MIGQNNKKVRLWLWLLVTNLVIIWGNSLLPGEISGAMSNAVKTVLLKILPIRPGDGPGGGGLIRKAAHFTEFTCLGICLSHLFRFKFMKKIQCLLYPFVCGVAVAAVDETIQRFVPDRGPSIWDVMLDSTGVIAGIVIVTLIFYFKMKKQLIMEENKQ